MPGPAPCRAGAALLALAVLVAGCANGTPAVPAPAEADRLCARRASLPRVAPGRVSAPPDLPQDAIHRLATLGFSAAAIEIAEVIGAGGALLQMATLDGSGPHAEAVELQFLRLRQAVMDRILLAMLDVSGTLAALDCEGERGDQLRVRLEGREARRARQFGLATIMVGALTATLSGGLAVAGSAAADMVGIVGGVTEASLATTLLFGGTTGALRTSGNMLREVWLRPAQSVLFPASVWRYLTRRPATDPEHPTMAEIVIEAWRTAELLAQPDTPEEAARVALLFGDRGTFTVEDLEARDAMLDLLEAGIALMNRDLRALLEELLTQPMPQWNGRATRARRRAG